MAGITPEDSSIDSSVGGSGPAVAPPAIWFTRLLLLVQGTILAIGTTLALAEVGPSGIKEINVVGAVIAGVPPAHAS